MLKKNIDRKSKKWWHRIFFHFLDLTLYAHNVLGLLFSESSVSYARIILSDDELLPRLTELSTCAMYGHNISINY